jgi:hypothetical protein
MLRGVPDDLRFEAAATLGGLAAQLADWAASLRATTTGRPVRAKLNPIWHLTTTQILAAHAVERSNHRSGPGGATTVCFEKPAERYLLP